MALTALDITYATAMGQGKRLMFAKKKGKEQQSVNLQPIKGAAPVFLWASYSELLMEDAVLEIRLLRGTEALPSDGPPGVWRKIKRDLSAGKVKPLTFLAYRVGPPSETEPPIVAVAVLRPDDKLGEWRVLLLPLSPACPRLLAPFQIPTPCNVLIVFGGGVSRVSFHSQLPWDDPH